MSRRHLAAALAICLALALPHLTGDLYGDERGHSLRYVTAGAWADILRDPALVHPPLFFVLAKAAVAVVGSPWAMRLPSLIAALALLPATAAAAARVLGPGFAVPAAYAAACSPFVLEFATEGRAYALVLLFSALSLSAFHDFLERESAGRAAALAAALIGGSLTHFVFLPLAAFFGACYLVKAGRVSRAALGVAAAFALAVGPFVYVQAQSGTSGVAELLQGAWSGGNLRVANLLGRVAVALVYGYNLFLLGRLDPARNVGVEQLRENLPIAAAVALVFVAIAAALLRTGRERRGVVLLLAAGAAVPAGIAVAGGGLGWYLVREKHLAAVWVFALLLTLAGLAWLWERPRWRPVVFVHAALIAFALFNATFRADRYSRRMNWSGLAAALRQEFGERDRLLSYDAPVAGLTDQPLPLRPGDPRETVLGTAAGAPGGVAAAVAALDANAAGRIFVVYDETGRNLVDPGDLALDQLRGRRVCSIRSFGRNLALHVCARSGGGQQP